MEPDVLPFGGWPYNTPASNGNKYVLAGAINLPSTVALEVLGQKLEFPLIKGEKYRLLMDIANWQAAPKDGINEAIAAVWLGNNSCQRTQFAGWAIATDTVWQTVAIDIVPDADYTHIMLSAILHPITNLNSATLIDHLRPYPCDTAAHYVPEPEAPDLLSGLEELEYLPDFVLYPNPNAEGVVRAEWKLPLDEGLVGRVRRFGAAGCALRRGAGRCGANP